MEALTEPELRAVLAAARASRERDFLMILVGYSHGLRAKEITKLRPADIRSGYVTVARLKGSERTTQPLLESADPLFNERAALFEFMRGRLDYAPLFNISVRQFERLFSRYCAQVGIPEHKRHPHVLKHSLAMHSLKRGAQINEVQAYLGHKSLGSTGMYLRVNDEEASSAVQRALSTPPRD